MNGMIYLLGMKTSNEIVELATKACTEISHGTDGPVTPFVVLMRAMEAVAKGADPDVMGNAVAMWMEDNTSVNMNG